MKLITISNYFNKNITLLDMSTIIIGLVVVVNILTYFGVDPFSIHGIETTCSTYKINLLTSIR
jgi:hypothetical protein